MQNQINLNPITQLIQQIRSAELSQAKEVKINIQQARMVSLALLEIMNKINSDYETMYNSLLNNLKSETISVSMDGGGFEES